MKQIILCLCIFTIVSNCADKTEKPQIAQKDALKKTWWKEAVVYQIYPRSFKDTDGDGVGD